MADIDVVPKKRTHMWIWIVVAIVLALIILAVMGTFSNDPTRTGRLLDGHPTILTAADFVSGNTEG